MLLEVLKTATCLPPRGFLTRIATATGCGGILDLRIAKKDIDPPRGRTWNLLIRSQTLCH